MRERRKEESLLREDEKKSPALSALSEVLLLSVLPSLPFCVASSPPLPVTLPSLSSSFSRLASSSSSS